MLSRPSHFFLEDTDNGQEMATFYGESEMWQFVGEYLKLQLKKENPNPTLVPDDPAVAGIRKLLEEANVTEAFSEWKFLVAQGGIYLYAGEIPDPEDKNTLLDDDSKPSPEAGG